MIAKRQIVALQYMIFVSKNASTLGKQIATYLIEQSAGLRKDVCLTLVEGRDGYSAEEISEAVSGFSCMLSGNCSTHLNEITLATGTKLHFSYHYGDFDPNRDGDKFSAAGQFEGALPRQVSNPELLRSGMPLRYTFWLARKSYSREATLVTVTHEQFDEQGLPCPDVYPKEVLALHS